MTDLIDAALAMGLDTRRVVMGVDVLPRTGETFVDVFPSSRAVVIADENTWGAAGESVQASLARAGVDMDAPIIYPGTPVLFADDAMVEQVRSRLSATSAVAVSIASGSLNDVTKLASHLLDRSYMNVCTAASVDGYTSFGAAITVKGMKTTAQCRAPRAVIVPLDVMAAAPSRLTATGYGDLIEKIPAGADWIIADALGIEPINDSVWHLVQGPLRSALSDPAGIAAGGIEAVTGLTEELIMSGLAMQVAQSSRPASGAGHYFSHQWEMEGLGRDWTPPLSHGFKVGLGTVAMCALYERVFQLDVESLSIPARLETWPTADEDQARVSALQSNETIRAGALEQSAGKYLQPSQARRRLEAIREAWPLIREKVAAQVLPAGVVASMLRQAGAVYHPTQLGMSLDRLRETYYQAQTIRTRYTVLDLLAELGLLESVVESLFQPGGYWATAERP